MKNAVTIIGALILAFALVCGLCLALVEPVKGKVRKDYSKAAVKMVEDTVKSGGEEKVVFMVPVTDALAVEGENGETDAGLDKLMNDMSSLSLEHESLTLLGILDIPCINVEEPVWDTCSVNALRYGVGRYPGTVDIGGDGLCNLFGHRQIGDLDTKLGSIQYLADMIGESVLVTTTDGIQHRYRIVDTLYVTDSELMPYLDPESFDKETLCITACGWGEDPLTGNYYPRNTEFVVVCKP